MRKGYIFAIFVIVFIITGFIYLLLYPLSVQNTPLENVSRSANIFVPSLSALLAAVIALSMADPRKNKIKIETEIFMDRKKKPEIHKKEYLSEDLKTFYKDFPEPIQSQRVHFKIINVSGFDLKKPVFTFKFPPEKGHPNKTNTELTFNSNMYNSQRELAMLEMADKLIVSNSNLPYFNKTDYIIFWFRMILNDGKLEPFLAEISVNCENAEGITKPITINPKELQESAAQTACKIQEKRPGENAKKEEPAAKPQV